MISLLKCWNSWETERVKVKRDGFKRFFRILPLVAMATNPRDNGFIVINYVSVFFFFLLYLPPRPLLSLAPDSNHVNHLSQVCFYLFFCSTMSWFSNVRLQDLSGCSATVIKALPITKTPHWFRRAMWRWTVCRNLCHERWASSFLSPRRWLRADCVRCSCWMTGS